MPMDAPQRAELAALEHRAAVVAKRTHTRFIADEKKRTSFMAFSNTVAAYSCEGSLGVWGKENASAQPSANNPSTTETPVSLKPLP